jgi:hypothetical protein
LSVDHVRLEQPVRFSVRVSGGCERHCVYFGDGQPVRICFPVSDGCERCGVLECGFD